MKAPNHRTLQYISMYSDDVARLGYNHIQTRKKRKKAKAKLPTLPKETTPVLTKSANAQASPGQAIYDLLRTYRRGARYGVMLSPVAHEKQVEDTINHISTLKSKLENANLSKQDDSKPTVVKPTEAQ